MTDTDPASAATTSGAQQWADAVDTYRDVAKWLIAAFGAIGAVVAGTAPLSGIGNASSSRVGWLAAGGAAALIGVTIVLASTIAVLIPQAVYRHELRARRRGWWRRTFVGLSRFEDLVATSPQDLIPPEFESLDKFSDAITWLRTRYYDMARRSLTEPTAATAAASMKASLIRYQQVMDDLLMVARFERARTRFNQAAIAVMTGGIVTALGLAMLLYGIASKTGK